MHNDTKSKILFTLAYDLSFVESIFVDICQSYVHFELIKLILK